VLIVFRSTEAEALLQAGDNNEDGELTFAELASTVSLPSPLSLLAISSPPSDDPPLWLIAEILFQEKLIYFLSRSLSQREGVGWEGTGRERKTMTDRQQEEEEPEPLLALT
jgi:hypothetical protein